MRRYALRDDQWDRIKDFLPGREGHVGGTAADNRLFVEAALYRYRAGIPWRDLPERFGDWKIVHQRFGRWAKSGVFERIFKLLASDHDNEYEVLRDSLSAARVHATPLSARNSSSSSTYASTNLRELAASGRARPATRLITLRATSSDTSRDHPSKYPQATIGQPQRRYKGITLVRGRKCHGVRSTGGAFGGK
jgi:transposase